MEIKNLLLGAVIAIIFLMFCVYGIKLMYNGPEYEDFCENTYSSPEKTSNTCNINNKLQDKANQCYNSKGIVRYKYDYNGCRTNLTCDFCNRDFEEVNKDYTKNLFLISLIFGIVVIIISVLFIGISAISGGLMTGSLFFIIYGTGGYWNFMDDWVRFIILGITLGILISLAYYLKNKKWGRKNEKSNPI